MGQSVRLTTEDWARVRYEYESTNHTVFDICAEHGISESTLRDRVRRWGWTRRWSGPVQREGPPPVVTRIEPQTPEGSPGDPADDVDELRASLERQIEALIEEEREARPRRYLAAWEEFAAQAAQPYAAVTRTFSPRPRKQRRH